MKSICRFTRANFQTCDDYAEAARAGRLMLGQYARIDELEKTVRFAGERGGNVMTLYQRPADAQARAFLRSRATELRSAA